jgi:hypothetical protein
MKSFLKAATAAALAIAAAIGPVAPGNAAAFFAWSVVDVPAWDLLNVRAWPSSKSQILVGYPNGTLMSLTGKCTGGVNLDAIAGWSRWQQRQAVRYEWCEAWIDPQGNGAYRSGWVYGKFIAPA